MLERKKSLNAQYKIVNCIYSSNLIYYNITDKLRAFKGYKLQLDVLGYIVDQGQIKDRSFLVRTVNAKINKKMCIAKHSNVRSLVYSCLKKGTATKQMIANLNAAYVGLSNNDYQIEFRRLIRLCSKKGIKLKLREI